MNTRIVTPEQHEYEQAKAEAAKQIGDPRVLAAIESGETALCLMRNLATSDRRKDRENLARIIEAYAKVVGMGTAMTSFHAPLALALELVGSLAAEMIDTAINARETLRLSPARAEAKSVIERVRTATATLKPVRRTRRAPRGCPECARLFGPKYAGPCEHGGDV